MESKCMDDDEDGRENWNLADPFNEQFVECKFVWSTPSRMKMQRAENIRPTYFDRHHNARNDFSFPESPERNAGNQVSAAPNWFATSVRAATGRPLSDEPCSLSPSLRYKILKLASGCAQACQEREETRRRRQAQRQSAVESSVSRINTGSVARCEPSAKTRQTCATVIRPKTMPVVMR